MKTNSIFDINRFSRLIAYDLKLNGTSYLLKLAAFTLLLYIWILTQMRQSPGQFMWYAYGYQGLVSNVQGYLSAFLIGLIPLGVFIGTSFSNLGNKVSRTLYIQLPASTTEKYLYSFLLRIVLGTGLFFVVFWMDAQLARLTFEHVNIGNLTMYYHNGIIIKPEVFDYSMVLDGGSGGWSAIFAVISLGAFLFACPLFFRKQQLLKSIFVFFAAIFLVVCLFVLCSHLFYPDQVRGFNMYINDVSMTQKINYIEWAFYALIYLSWPFFLAIGFFRLKESTL